MNRSVTTIYYHYRKNGGRKMRPPSFNRNTNQELIGEFIGLFAGDGHLQIDDSTYKTFFYFNKNEKTFVDELTRSVFVPLFNKSPLVRLRGNRWDCCYYAKCLHQLIKKYLRWNPDRAKTYTVQLRKTNHGLDFMRGFLRGSVDSDGYISPKMISFATVSRGLQENISYFLRNFGIVHSVRRYREKRPNRVDIYHIVVWRKDHQKFMNLIKPRNLKNGAPAEICSG